MVSEERWQKYDEQMAILEAKKPPKPTEPRDPSPGPGQPEGFTGEHVYGNGDRAQSQVHNGKRNGRGRFSSNGKYDRGWNSRTFLNDKLNGLGKPCNSEDKVSWDIGRCMDGELREERRM